MDAARIAERRIPLIAAGKMRLTIWINTIELSEISPRNMRPATAERTEKERISTVQVIPIFALFETSLSDLTAMNLMMIWGIPK